MAALPAGPALHDGLPALHGGRAGRFVRRHLWVALACAVLMLPALLDLPQLAGLEQTAEHTVDAVFAVLGVMIVAGLVQRWTADRQAERDAARYRETAKIVFRGLSQTVNDAYRIQAAPALGLSLYDAAVPGSTRQDHEDDLRRLHEAGLSPAARPSSGFWHAQYGPDVVERLTRLAAVPGFAEHMFRQSARARRLLQQAFTEAATVAIAVPRAVEELAEITEVADDLVRAQEAWRAAASSSCDDDVCAEAARVCGRTLASVDRALMVLQRRAALPAGGVGAATAGPRRREPAAG